MFDMRLTLLIYSSFPFCNRCRPHNLKVVLTHRLGPLQARPIRSDPNSPHSAPTHPASPRRSRRRPTAQHPAPPRPDEPRCGSSSLYAAGHRSVYLLSAMLQPPARLQQFSSSSCVAAPLSVPVAVAAPQAYGMPEPRPPPLELHGTLARHEIVTFQCLEAAEPESKRDQGEMGG